MQADHRVPAGGVRRGEILDQTGDLAAVGGWDVRAPGQRRRDVARGRGVVVLVRPRQRDDEATGDVVGEPLHVVDLRRQEELADVGEHGFGHDVAGRVRHRVDGGGDAAGEEALDDLDQLDHGVADVRGALGADAVGFADQDAGADEEVAEPGACADAAVAVVVGIGRREVAAVPPFAGEEHPLPRHDDVVEVDDRRRLGVAGAEPGPAITRPAGGPGDHGDAVGVDGNGAADGEVGVLTQHRSARHDQELVHVGSAGDDGLGAADDQALGSALADVDVDVGVGLGVRPKRPVALAVGHGDGQGQVLVLDPMDVGEETRVVVGAAVGIDATAGLEDRIEAVVGEVALGTATLAADDAHRFELVEEVARLAVDVQEAIGLAPARVLGRHHQRPQLRPQREVIGDADGVDSGLEQRLVGDRGDLMAVDEDLGAIAPKRLPVVGCRHEHGGRSPPLRLRSGRRSHIVPPTHPWQTDGS